MKAVVKAKVDSKQTRPAVSSPGPVLMKWFMEERQSKKVPTEEDQLEPVVFFTNGKRIAVLYVSKIGGYLVAGNGKTGQSLRVCEALAWYRKQIAEKWFFHRDDGVEGWLMFLGMAEALSQQVNSYPIKKGGAR